MAAALYIWGRDGARESKRERFPKAKWRALVGSPLADSLTRAEVYGIANEKIDGA